MPGKYQYDIELKSNVAKLLTDMKEVQDRLDTVEGKEYKIKLNVDEKKLSNVISNLEKMLDSLGKGTGDFKQFENLSKELSSIVSEVQNLSKAFGKVDDSGTKTLLSSIQNIDKSLSELSQHIINVNKNMSNIGGDTNGTVKQVENISNAYDNAAKSAEKLADAQSKIGNKSNISSGTQIKDVFQGDKIDQVTTSAKELDNTLEQVNIPTDSFDEVLSKLDLAKSELGEIIKITKQSVSDSEGKFHDSYTLKDKRGSTEIYGLSSNTEKGQLLRSNIVEYDAKEIEKANKQILKSEQKVQAQKDAFHKKNLTAIDLEIQKREEEAKSFSSSLKAQMEERQKDISSMESSLKSFNESSKQLSAKPDDQHQFSSWKKQLEDLNIKIAEYKSKVENLSKIDIADETQINKAKSEIEELGNSIKDTIASMKNIPQASRGWNQTGVDKLIQRMNDDLKKNSKYTDETKQKIQGLIDELNNIPDRPLSEVFNDFSRFKREAHDAGKEGKAFFEIFKEKVIYGGAAQLAGMFGFYDVINVIRQAGEAVIDLNTNITELAKVSEASVSQIYDDFNSYADIAKEVGGTISDTISATADWSRNGYNIPDAKELAEVAMIYKNVGDGIDIDQANEYLISTLRGFSLEANDAMDIIDSINEVANNEPISSAGIGEALQRSAAAFNVANTSLQESIALVTSTNSVLQSPEKVGSMWTTVSARIRGAKTELEDAGLETDGMVESTSKLQAMIKGMTGFDILEDDQKTFKSIYDIIIGIGEEFQNLSGVDQAALLEALAGKRQSNALAATLNNIDLLKKAYGEATNAEGSAMAEQEKYQQSIQYSIDRTKASLEELANDFISSDFLKGLIDSGDKLINLLDLLIDKFGVLGTAAGIGGIFAGFKNVGINTLVAY